MEVRRIAFKILTGKHTGKRSLGRPKYRCYNNIRMCRKEISVSMWSWIE